MEATAIIEILATIVAALGGWEAIRYFINRKTNKRKEEAEADSIEFNVLKNALEFLQVQFNEKEIRFVEQTERLRKWQSDYYDLMKEKQAIELELQRFRCVRPKCANREPQNGY